MSVELCIEGNKRSRNYFDKVRDKLRSGSADLTRLEKSDSSRAFFPDWIANVTEKIFWFFVFSLKIVSKMGANIPSRVELDGEYVGSISRARGDLQQCRMVSYVSKNVFKRKSATLKKYGGKMEMGGPKFFRGMYGVIFCWTDGEGPGWFAWLLRLLECRLPWERPRFRQLQIWSPALWGRYLEVKEGVMGAGKSVLYSCLLDHRSWFAPSTWHSKATCALWRTSKSLTDAKLCVGKAEIYQVKKMVPGTQLPESSGGS